MKTNDTPSDPVIRLLDANANRCAEGLRTLEDLARFVLNDGGLSGEFKALRHELRVVLEELPIAPTARFEARDTPGDVGTGLSTPTERSRAGLGAVGGAAGSRATESLRVLEEASKALAPGFGERFEALRYRVYGLVKNLRVKMHARAPQWKLCVLLTTDLCEGRDPVEIARGAIEGGADCLQIREKTMDSGPMLELIKRIIGVARPSGTSVIVNDRADLARLAGADGVHVGQSDLSVFDTRRIAGEGAIVGVSTANLEQARRAVLYGASYCGCGPVFASTTKAKPTLSGPAYLTEYLNDECVRETPHLAISGITPENIGRLAEVGCRGVAVSSVVCGAQDPASVCRDLISAMTPALTPG